MARNQSPLTVWSQYLALRTVSGFMHCFDVEQNLQTAAHIGSLFYRLSASRRKRVLDNITASFPEWPADRVAEVGRRSIQHMFQLFLVDAMVLARRVTETSWPNYTRFGELKGALERLIRGQPTIFITGHCGNWELLGYTLSVVGYPVHALARPLDNPLLNRWVLGMREARGGTTSFQSGLWMMMKSMSSTVTFAIHPLRQPDQYATKSLIVGKVVYPL